MVILWKLANITTNMEFYWKYVKIMINREYHGKPIILYEKGILWKGQNFIEKLKFYRITANNVEKQKKTDYFRVLW